MSVRHARARLPRRRYPHADARTVARVWLPQIMLGALVSVAYAAVVLTFIFAGHVWIGGGALNA